MAFPARIREIASLIAEDEDVVDVGADHGLLELALLEKGHSGRLLAVENKEGPYLRLRQELAGSEAQTLLGDGLRDVPKDYRTAVFAGLGGRLIIKILERDLPLHPEIERIITDAHRDVEGLRRYVTGHGFLIEKEKIVEEKGHFYFLIAFRRGKRSYTDLEYEFGVGTGNDPAFAAYRAAEIGRIEAILADPSLGGEARARMEDRKGRLMKT